MLNIYLDLNFNVLDAATSNRYIDAFDKRFVNLGPIALFSIYRSTVSSVKQLEENSHAHIASLIYKLITSARGADDLRIGFDRDRDRKQRELTNNRNQKGKYHIKIYFEKNFGFVQHRAKTTFGLGLKLLMTRNSDNSVFNKDNATNIGKFKNIAFEWYVPKYTPSIPQEAFLSEEIFSKMPTELQYVERSVFMKEVNTQRLWIFDLRTQEV